MILLTSVVVMRGKEGFRMSMLEWGNGFNGIGIGAVVCDEFIVFLIKKNEKVLLCRIYCGFY